MQAPAAPGFRRSHPLRRLVADENLLFLGLAAAVGVGGALVGIGFQQATRALSALSFGSDLGTTDLLAAAREAPAWRRVAAPVLGALAAAAAIALLARLSRARPGDAGSGIPDVMELFARGDRRLSLRASLRGAFGAWLVIGSGGSAGLEGPKCQLATTLAAKVAGALRLSRQRARTLVVAGVAAGMAAAYNTPLAATLFAVEVLVRWDQAYVLPCAVSGASATLALRLLGSAEPLYARPDLSLGSPWNVLGLLALAVAGGALAAGFMHALRGTALLVRRLRLPAPAAFAAGGLAVGLLGLGLPHVYGNGYEAATGFLMRGAAEGWVLALLVLLGKLVATSATIGSGAPGGVFTPTLVLGAALGAALGQGAAALAPPGEASPALYAAVGMAALLAGTTHAPFLSMVMLAELTGNWGLVLALIIPVFVAISASHLFHRDSIYEGELRRRGISWAGESEEVALRNLRVTDVMRRNVPLVPEDLPLSEVLRIFAQTRSTYLYVGGRDGLFRGVIDLHDVKGLMGADASALAGIVLAQDIVQEIPAVYPDDSLVTVNEKLWFRDLGHLPVLESPGRRRFLGIVTRRDLLGAIDHEILRRDSLMARVGAPGAPGAEYVALPPEHRIEEISLPEWLEGKTLGEADLRGSYGITVLAAARPAAEGREERVVPRPDWVFRRGDTLVVLGSEADTRRLSGGGPASPPLPGAITE
ncbi:MAG: chloride channel protein [Planctomycetales bacterium]|nr:chloride channel protein [Planctomycetales bacterium]